MPSMNSGFSAGDRVEFVCTDGDLTNFTIGKVYEVHNVVRDSMGRMRLIVADDSGRFNNSRGYFPRRFKLVENLDPKLPDWW